MSQENDLNWIPLYLDDLLGDVNVEAMELDELGAYIRLWKVQVRNGSIPSDLRILARILKVREPGLMERIWDALAPCYTACPDKPGQLIQGRLEEERGKAVARLRGSSKGGKTAAERLRAKSQLTVKLEATTEIPETYPQPIRKPVIENCGVTPKLKAAFDLVASRYPQCTGVDMAFQIWMGYCESGLVTEANVHEVGEGLTRYLESEKWARDDGRYIDSFDKWIGAKKWRDRPNPSAEARANRRVEKRSSDGSDPSAEWVAPWAKTDDGKD